MTRRIGTALLLGILTATSQMVYASPDTIGVVRIYAGNKNGGGKSGTGYFIKINSLPYICTAYHVIQGANSLSGYCNKGALSKISLAAFDADKDLALLNFTVPENTFPILYFGLIDIPPPNLVRVPAEIIGNPGSFDFQELSAAFTHDSYVDAKSNDVFRLDINMKIITAGTIVYNGMSGAPVIVNHKVIGTVSGSFNQGGAIVWIIPSIYTSRLKMLKVPVTDYAALPPLNMFRPNKTVKELTRSYEFEANAGANFNDYDIANAEYKEHNKDFKAMLKRHMDFLLDFKESVNSALTVADLIQVLKPYEDKFAINVAEITRLNAINREDYQKWTLNFHNLRNLLNDGQFKKFQLKNGRFSDYQIGLLKDSITRINQIMDNADVQKTLTRQLETDIEKNDFKGFKDHFINFIQFGMEQAEAIQKMLFVENKMISASDIMENEMIEVQRYKIKEE